MGALEKTVALADITQKPDGHRFQSECEPMITSLLLPESRTDILEQLSESRNVLATRLSNFGAIFSDF